MNQKQRVVVHFDETGFIRTYADDGAEIYWVDERCPNDRVYRATPDAIPDDMLGGSIGFAGDRSASEIKAVKLVKELKGEEPFPVIDGGKS